MCGCICVDVIHVCVFEMSTWYGVRHFIVTTYMYIHVHVHVDLHVLVCLVLPSLIHVCVHTFNGFEEPFYMYYRCTYTCTCMCMFCIYQTPDELPGIAVCIVVQLCIPGHPLLF